MKLSGVERKPLFQLYGIFGDPLRHTLSPRMQEAAFRKFGISAFYLPFEMDLRNFRKIMKHLPSLILDGFNVTVPHKENVIPFLDKVSAEASVIGAVNTVFRRGRKWMGENTDACGFLRSLKEEAKFSIKGKRALVLGAGGSARAVLYALCSQGAESVTVVNRNLLRAQTIVRHFGSVFSKVKLQFSALAGFDFRSSLELVDLLVQTTSIGLKSGDHSLIKKNEIPRAQGKHRLLVVDLIYKPAQTELLRIAKARGHRTLNGAGMLIFQGAKAFETWTGKKAPISEMRKALGTVLID